MCNSLMMSWIRPLYRLTVAQGSEVREIMKICQVQYIDMIVNFPVGLNTEHQQSRRYAPVEVSQSQ